MGNGVTMTRSVMIGYTGPLEAIRTYSYAGTALAAYSPTYDPVYNKTVITELDNVTTFTYDPARQLIGEVRSGSYPYNTTYLYDSMGNRIRKYDTTGITTNTYNPANQLLVSMPPSGPPTTSSYDNNGNLISAEHRRCAHDLHLGSGEPADLRRIVLCRTYDLRLLGRRPPAGDHK